MGASCEQAGQSLSDFHFPARWLVSVFRPLTCLTFVPCLTDIYGSVCATSIIRIDQIFATNWSETDLTWDGFGLNVWSTIESCTAIISSCLSTMRPLIVRAKALPSGLKNAPPRSNQAKTSSSEASGPQLKTPYQCLEDFGTDTYEMKDASLVHQTGSSSAVAGSSSRQLSSPRSPTFTDC